MGKLDVLRWAGVILMITGTLTVVEGRCFIAENTDSRAHFVSEPVAGVTSASACLTHCAGQAACPSVQWDWQRGECYPFSDVVESISPVTRLDFQKDPSKNCAVLKCATIITDWDRNDPPVVSLGNVDSKEECSHVCQLAGNCLEAQWTDNAKTCNFFNSPMSGITIVSGVAYIITNVTCGERTWRPSTVTKHLGLFQKKTMASQSQAMEVTSARSKLECSLRCLNKPPCLSFVFSSSGTCSLTSDLKNYVIVMETYP